MQSLVCISICCRAPRCFSRLNMSMFGNVLLGLIVFWVLSWCSERERPSSETLSTAPRGDNTLPACMTYALRLHPRTVLEQVQGWANSLIPANFLGSEMDSFWLLFPVHLPEADLTIISQREFCQNLCSTTWALALISEHFSNCT